MKKYITLYIMEIAIPVLAMTGLIMSSKNKGKQNENNLAMNKEKKLNEGFMNYGRNPVNGQNILPNTNIPNRNYPTIDTSTENNNNEYLGGNAVTDKYYNGNVDKRVLSGPDQFGNPYNRNRMQNPQDIALSLTGQPINLNEFQHNNMVPFFGAKIRGRTADANTHESILDYSSGTGSQKICKEERAPLFEPQNNMNYINGMPNHSDFFQSRVNPGTQMANVKPWQEIHVGPGLGQGYTACGSNGFNSGMEARDEWVDRNVDQLRVANNPKLTYSLENHEGPSYNWNVQQPPNAKTYGNVEKYLPDKFYLNTPDRWFTTTGAQQAAATRPIQMLPDVNRVCTTTEYFGADSNPNGTNTYVPGASEPSKKAEIDGKPVTNPCCPGKGSPTVNDYGRNNRLPTTNRSITEHRNEVGPIFGAIRAAVAPILEVLRPSRKEDSIGTIRPYGHVAEPSRGNIVYNPADRAPTTIKETTESLLDFNHLNVHPMTDGTGYLVAEQQPTGTQRATTEPEYIGAGGGATNEGYLSNTAAYNQHNNVNKESVDWTPGGCISTVSHAQNVQVKRADRNNSQCPWNPGPNPAVGTGAMPPSPDEYGKLSKMPQYYKESVFCERIQPDILDAFKKNPYTQSLASYVFP